MIKKCLGCGINLQTKDKEKEGYTEDLNNEICERCFKLKNYGEYKEVSFTNEDYTKILNTIPKDNIVIVHKVGFTLDTLINDDELCTHTSLTTEEFDSMYTTLKTKL